MLRPGACWEIALAGIGRHRARWPFVLALVALGLKLPCLLGPVGSPSWSGNLLRRNWLAVYALLIPLHPLWKRLPPVALHPLS